MSTKVVLNEKQWKTFRNILQGLSKQCNDVDIFNGVIRQRSNDSSAIFEVDLTSILGNLTLTISNTVEELERLKDLTGQLTIEAEEMKVVLSDGTSSYNRPTADRNYLDNKYLGKEEFDSLLGNVCQGTPLIKHRIDKKNIKRIRNAAKALHSPSYRVTFDNQLASVSVNGYGESKGIKPTLKIGRDIPLSEPVMGEMNLPIPPLDSFDYDGDIGWKLFKGDKKFISKHYGWVGEVPVSTFTRGELRNDEPELPPQPEEIPEEGGESEA